MVVFNKNYLMVVALLSLGVLSGCGDSASSKTQTDVLVKFNGHELTSQDCVRFTKLRAAMYQLMKKGATQDDLEKVRKSTYSAALPYFIQNCIIRDESAAFKKGHGDYADADRKAVKKWLEHEYAAKGEAHRDFGSIRREIANRGLQEDFDKQIDTEIESELFLKIACSNRYPIAEYVISNVYANWKVNNFVASTTNRSILALATNVVKKIKAGEDFTALANRYTMVQEENGDGDMGLCSAADFPGEEELWEAVKDLEPGQSTDIIDAGDSWQILKVLERDDTNQKDPKLHLARIYFRRAWEIERPSRAEVIAALEDDRRERLLNEILTARLKNAKIEFPRGRQVFPSIAPAKPYLDIIDGLATNLVNQSNGALQ